MKDEDKDHSLPGTVTFVTLLGIFIVVGWLLMFALTASRW